MILATRQPTRLAGLGLVLPNYYNPISRVLNGAGLGAVTTGGAVLLAFGGALLGHFFGRPVVKQAKRLGRKVTSRFRR